ncbi:MAG: sigma-70 family RNA polymerase sigma factor [Clostridiales bacterium]|nr:sigma-70 family RNA polymerase sigma factor [Clostridiales bacterium]
MEDRAIIDLYFKRDESAVSESITKYGNYCHRISMNILYDERDAEECVNDTWLRSWNSMPPARPTSLKAFFGKIVRNLSLSRYRMNHAIKRYSEMEVMLDELSDCVPSCLSVEKKVEDDALGQMISAWLDSLDKPDRVLFVRRYYLGEPSKKLAEDCYETPAEMAQKMLKLRRSLKSFIEREW